MAHVRFHPESTTGRFRLLLTEDRPHAPEHWTSQLPRLLEPHGVVSFIVRSAREAVQLAGRVELHAAVIDLATPLDPTPAARVPGGADLRVLELFRRLPKAPPLVVVHNAVNQRQLDRILREALRLHVFSVVAKPVEVETILRVFHRLLLQHYRGAWPDLDTLKN